MKRYAFTAKGKFTVTLLSFAVLVCVVAVISTQLTKRYPSSPSSSPSFASGVGLPSPDESIGGDLSDPPPSVSPSGVVGPSSSLQPITVTTPPPQVTPSPSQSWGTKSLVLPFGGDSSDVNGEMQSVLSQFMGNSPDLSGWIMVVEGFSKADESPDTLNMDRASAVSNFVIARYGLAADTVLPIKGSGSADDAYVEIYFIASGSK